MPIPTTNLDDSSDKPGANVSFDNYPLHNWCVLCDVML